MILKFLGRTLAGLLILIFLIGFLGYLYLKHTTLPQTQGQMTLPGLMESVSVHREPNGIVHIIAKNQTDLFFAQGIVHAQDRLWQMENQRLFGSGRLSEVFGKALLDIDKLSRTWGFYHLAENAYANLSPAGKATVEAYRNGINAYLATNPPLPLEFKLLGYSPTAWTPADVIVWTKMMSFSLATNRNTELKRYQLLAKGLSRERIAQLMPFNFDDESVAPFSPNILKPTAADQKQTDSLLAMTSLIPTFVEASNNWVLGGSRTTSGMPLLANDTHLRLRVPSTWHLMHLEAPDFNVIGATLPGLPCVIIGHNTQIAWGVTNLYGDVEDLYILQETEDGSGYVYQNESQPYQIRTEVIKVKNESPVSLKVRETVHGPVISDVVDKIPNAAPLALRWIGHHPANTTFDAYLALNQASNWTEFKNAMRHYVAPSQHFVYADVQGNIGYFVPGLLPIRKPGHNGLYPMPGNGEWDWQGFIPFAELPQQFNPESDYIITANNQIPVPNYPYTISLEWKKYRAMRIEQLVRSQEKHKLADMLTMQQDMLSLLYKDFIPIFEQLQPTSARAEQWRQRLLAWDGILSPDSQEATVFQAWYLGLSGLIKAETGEDDWHQYPRYFLNAMQNGDSACEALKMTCLEYATVILEQTLAQWDKNIPAWGQLHQATFNHSFLTHTPLAFLSDRQVPFGGDRFTVNAGRYDPPEGLKMIHGATYRQVVDLSNVEASRYMYPIGQSGHVLSPQYDDLLPLWQKGEYLPMQTKDYQVAETLILEPMI